MKLESYLTSVISALRNDILPVLPTPESRDQMFNCLRVLTRLSLVVTPPVERRAALLADEVIPKSIREAFAGEPTTIDLPPVAEEISVTTGTLVGTRAAGDWLECSDWCDDPDRKRVAQALLGHEKQWRTDSLAQMKAAQRSEAGAGAETLSGQFLTQETLQDYLRVKLANPALSVTEYKRVSGGRTRKTVVFKQEGHADWPEWLVIQCDPKKGYVEFPGVLS